jgi:hypothetical protein
VPVRRGEHAAGRDAALQRRGDPQLDPFVAALRIVVAEQLQSAIDAYEQPNRRTWCPTITAAPSTALATIQPAFTDAGEG